MGNDCVCDEKKSTAGGQAFTGYWCALCEGRDVHENTHVPMLCKKCVEKFGFCKWCGDGLLKWNPNDEADKWIGHWVEIEGYLHKTRFVGGQTEVMDTIMLSGQKVRIHGRAKDFSRSPKGRVVLLLGAVADIERCDGAELSFKTQYIDMLLNKHTMSSVVVDPENIRLLSDKEIMVYGL